MNGIVPADAYGEAKCSLRGEIASRFAASAENNAVLATPTHLD
jgi:hypothetical protein